MDSQKNSTTNINTMSHPQIKKGINIVNIIISLVLIVAGVLMFVLFSRSSDTKSTLSMVYLTIGAVLIIVGIVMIFAKSKQHVHAESGSTVKNKSYSFNKDQVESVKSSLNNNSFSKTQPLKVVDNGTIRMDVIKSTDNKFAAVQLFEYIPFVYEEITPVYYFDGEQAEEFIKFLEK